MEPQKVLAIVLLFIAFIVALPFIVRLFPLIFVVGVVVFAFITFRK